MLPAAVLAVLLVAVCDFGPWPAENPAESMASAGFSDTAGLEVLAVEELETFVKFALRGSPSDINRALAAAEFTAPPTPGISVFQTPVPGADLVDLADPRTALDKWINPSGEMIQRELVRGTTPDGSELVHVWAFTT
jgi:hypothetical protein